MEQDRQEEEEEEEVSSAAFPSAGGASGQQRQKWRQEDGQQMLPRSLLLSLPERASRGGMTPGGETRTPVE